MYPSDLGGSIFFFALRMFLRRYGEGHHEEAAVWARKLGESYCLVMLKHFRYADPEDETLWSLSQELPEWVWQHSAWEHAAAYGDPYRRWAESLGMHMARFSVYDDLQRVIVSVLRSS